MRTKTWVVLIAALAAVLAAASAWTLGSRGRRTVQIVQDGVVIREIDLDQAKEERFSIAAKDGGSNTVVVQTGRICILEADCPDKICVQRGWLTEGAPIVCLPHKLVIRPVGNTQLDGVSQ